MIKSETYSKEHIKTIKAKYPNLDQFIIERTIYAFGLLEALVKAKLPFVFKGGTSLILLLSNPYRLSTDIDIIVEPDTDITKYLEKAGHTLPFIRKEEQVRKGKNDIIKQHFKFYYKSPSSETEIPILLDVLYEYHGYTKVIDKEIENDMLITEGDNLIVKVPSIESILGDKLTAFAPNTTGIEYQYVNKDGITITKHLEVIKQFLDVAKLIEDAMNFNDISDTYSEVVKQEIDYRGLAISKEEALQDTFDTALSILTRGAVNKSDYDNLKSGIRKIRNHVFGVTINGETVVKYASKVMLMSAQLITNTKSVTIGEMSYIKDKKFKSINGIKKVDPTTYNTAVISLKLLDII